MRDRVAIAVFVLGALLVGVGLVGSLGDDNADDNEVTATVTPPGATVSVPEPAETQTVVRTPAGPASTTAPAPAAITAPPIAPSTGITDEVDDGSTAEDTESQTPITAPEESEGDPALPDESPETVQGFFDVYVAAIADGDTEFLFDRLHPVVLDQPTADLCRAFIEREILALGNYRIDGEIEGPIARDVAGTIVAELYSLPVAFEFGGQTFEGTATFAPIEGEMRWFTTCR